MIQGKIYTKLDLIGKGGSSLVFRVLDPDRKIYAMKEVDLAEADDATIESYVNEIRLLERLRGRSSIIQLVAYERDTRKKCLFIVMECGDVDLATMLKNRRQEKRTIDENHLRLYWQQMLEAVQTIHNERIVHSDLKPANFLFVSGVLKLIDFGIAKGIQV
jgi:serine/threonine-protein kinase TTK/MPS1